MLWANCLARSARWRACSICKNLQYEGQIIKAKCTCVGAGAMRPRPAMAMMPLGQAATAWAEDMDTQSSMASESSFPELPSYAELGVLYNLVRLMKFGCIYQIGGDFAEDMDSLPSPEASIGTISGDALPCISIDTASNGRPFQLSSSCDGVEDEAPNPNGGHQPSPGMQAL